MEEVLLECYREERTKKESRSQSNRTSSPPNEVPRRQIMDPQEHQRSSARILPNATHCNKSKHGGSSFRTSDKKTSERINISEKCPIHSNKEDWLKTFGIAVTPPDDEVEWIMKVLELP